MANNRRQRTLALVLGIGALALMSVAIVSADANDEVSAVPVRQRGPP